VLRTIYAPQLYRKGEVMSNKGYLPKSFQELEGCSREEVRELWGRFFNSMPAVSEFKILRMLWYKIQCESHNLRIEQKNITKLNRYSVDPDRHIEKAYKTKYHLKNGLVIVKTFRGREHKVLVKSSREFVYDNRSYGTLSAVAKTIYGKNVSGYDFFGLNSKNYQASLA
jgi:hypothetical protein